MPRTEVTIDDEDYEIEFDVLHGEIEDAKKVSTDEYIEDAFTPSQVDSVIAQCYKYLEWRKGP